MMIMSRQGQEHSPKYVHFANGFPPKELIPAQGLSSGVKIQGGVFVGLHEEATSKLTKSQRTIPPLAKGRANYFPVKHRVSSSRYRDVANPFDAHKGTEKTGFTPQAIKRSKPKLEKTNGRNEHNMITHTQSTPAVNNPNISLKMSRQTMCPVSTLLHGNESIPRSPSEANSRILYDVEKDVIQNELLGIDEVYKKVCNGSMDSLCSLISPVKGKQRLRQASSMHYIQTPLPLNTKTLKAPHCSSKEEESEASPEKDGRESENYDQGLKNKLTKQSPHTILVPLPYFTAPSRPPHTAPARFKENYNRPRIYGTRTSYLKQRSGALSSLSGWSSPSVINFNASDLPQISRPVTRACGVVGPTGSIIGVQNKSHTGKVAIVASVDAVATPPATPPATAASEFYKHQFDINNHGQAATNGKDYSPEVDSISSEDIRQNIIVNDDDLKKDEQETKQTGVTGDDGKMSQWEQGEEDVEDVSNKISGMNVAVTLNVIDETGSVNDVEIYDPEERDLQKQEQVTRDIQEAQKNYQKRKQEIETLLDEHGNLVHQVSNLSKELQD